MRRGVDLRAKVRALIASGVVPVDPADHTARAHAYAEQHLATATTMLREMGMRFWLEKAEEEMQGST